MELTAGLGSVDDYIRYIEAGADECFCGYIPYAWDRKYGTVLSLNRREVRCCSVQLGAFSELEILAAMVRAYQKPVQLTFNSLYYLPPQYPEIAENHLSKEDATEGYGGCGAGMCQKKFWIGKHEI